MKASVKRRDGEEALLRVKIPFNMFGLPVCSGVTMGSSEELGLHLSTLFTSGPSCRVMFMPNDSQTPFSFTVKAGIGSWGSPTGSSFVISAQLKLPATSQRPSFSFSIKPRLGDFSLCKSLKGVRLEKLFPESSSSNGIQADGVSKPVSEAELAKVFDKEEDEKARLMGNELRNGQFDDEWMSVEKTRGVGFKTTPGALNDWSLVSHGSFPLGQNINARIRWRMGIPGESFGTLASDPQRFFSRLSLPVLSLDKVSLHQTEPGGEPGMKSNRGGKRLAGKDARLVSVEAVEWIEENEELNKVATMCSSIRRQLHLVYSENRVLRSTMEEMKRNFNERVSPGSPGLERVPGPGVRQPSVGHRNKDGFLMAPEERNKVTAPPSPTQQKREEQKSKAKERNDSSSRKTPVDTSQIAKELERALGTSK